MMHLHVHPENPQQRLIAQAVERIRAGDVVVYPTDAAYAIGVKSVIKVLWNVLHRYVV